MERIKAMLEAVQKGNLFEAEKLLFAEMDDRKEKIMENGREFIAASIKA